MKCNVTILYAPAAVGLSYGSLKFARYGVLAFEYEGGFLGPIHFINFPKSVIIPEYKGCKAVQAWFPADVLAAVQMVPEIDTTVADQYIAGQAVNLLTGKGLPLVLGY